MASQAVQGSDGHHHSTAGFHPISAEIKSGHDIKKEINDSVPMSVELHPLTPEMRPKKLASFVREENWLSHPIKRNHGSTQNVLSRSLSSAGELEKVRQPDEVDNDKQKMLSFLGSFKQRANQVSLPEFPSLAKMTGSKPSLDHLELIQETEEDLDGQALLSLLPPIRELQKKNPTNNHRNDRQLEFNANQDSGGSVSTQMLKYSQSSTVKGFPKNQQTIQEL